jgi:hypothetical protein
MKAVEKIGLGKALNLYIARKLDVGVLKGEFHPKTL